MSTLNPAAKVTRRASAPAAAAATSAVDTITIRWS